MGTIDAQNRSLFDVEILSWIQKGATSPRGSDFNTLALKLFTHQFESLPIYRAYCQKRDISPKAVVHFRDIPPFPTSGFKYHRIASFPGLATAATFHTTGTTTGKSGIHAFDTLALYDLASIVSFKELTGLDVDRYGLFSLIPSRLKAPRSSLSHMVDTLAPLFAERFSSLKAAASFRKPIFIASTSAALADLLEDLAQTKTKIILPPTSALFETGGRKGRRSIPDPQTLSEMARELLGINEELYFGEYGMTELSSPSWGKLINGSFIYQSPSWAPIRIIHPETEEEVSIGDEGMVSIFDLANRGSISALYTGDWGRRHAEGFEVLGRVIDSELRGCSLSVSPITASTQHSTSAAPSTQRAKEDLKRSTPPSIEKTIDTLDTLTNVWLNPASPERTQFEKRLSQTHPYSPGSITEGLNRTFSALTKERLKSIPTIQRSDGSRMAVAVSAGNLPVTGVFGFYTGLLTAVPTIHRPSARSGGLLQELSRSLEEIDPELARLAAIVTTPSENDAVTRELFCGATEIYAQGDDSTLEHLLSLAPATAKFFPYRSRFSVALGTPRNETECQALLEDLFIWEQQGCLSPQILFVQDEPHLVAMQLLATAMDFSKRWHLKPPLRHLGQRYWNQRSGECQGNDLTFHKNRQLTLACSSSIHPEYFSTPGLLQIIQTDSPKEILKYYQDRLSSVAVNSERPDLSCERIVRFGELQSPTLGWPQDGHDRLQ